MREKHDCNFRIGMGCINDCCPLHRGMRTLAENLRVAAFGATMFKAGDNFGLHMGDDQSQCTCQWSPNTHGEPYRGWTRCEQDDFDDHSDCECTGADPFGLLGDEMWGTGDEP